MLSTVVLLLHEPILLARQIATLGAFSNGRITLGIGLGGDKPEYGRPDNPNRSKLMEEYMAAMRLLWAERTDSYTGRYVQFSYVEALPKPVQRPLPVFRAGHGEQVFKWIARHGPGRSIPSSPRMRCSDMCNTWRRLPPKGAAAMRS